MFFFHLWTFDIWLSYIENCSSSQKISFSSGSKILQFDLFLFFETLGIPIKKKRELIDRLKLTLIFL